MKKFILVLVLACAPFAAYGQSTQTPAIAALACAYNSVVPTPSDGQFFLVQCDSSGRLIAAGAAPSGAAGGDLTGTYPNPNVKSASNNGAASLPSFLVPGTLFTGGTATTTFPQIFVQPTGTAAVTTWSTSGTIIGANVISGFAGNFLDFHVAGASASSFKVDSTGSITLPFASNLTFTNRGSITSSAAGTIQIGLGDAAAPVAQTLRVQSVATGTSNTAGQNWTIAGSQGTGTGAGGSLVFQTAPAGGAGSTPNGLVTALTIASSGAATFVGNVSAVNVNATNTLNTGYVQAGGGSVLGWAGKSAFLSSVDGQIDARNNANSAYSFLRGKLQTDTNYTAGVPVVTGYLTVYDAAGTAYKVPSCTGC